jgi:hypothetical protein
MCLDCLSSCAIYGVKHSVISDTGTLTQKKGDWIW